ncbi:unnamed protein product [Urochloa decumbens]|uniref:Uncharacterized protein n=1 Tax=Urochloa decumbens TaxID=240449 RepID=A0ABC9C9Y6_9POAL
MDFLALPRRDLQALCKRNGVRANMTNAAMAEALAALPTVDGIEEYVKQPVAVPAPAAEEEEPRMEKQGSPLPRGRRVTAKTKEPSKPEDAKQANATREVNTEDAPAPRRGVSRRARGAPVVPKATGKASPEEEKQGSSLFVEDGEAEEDLTREANKEDAPAPVVVRRGASRRARPESAAEPAGAGAGEEQRDKEGSQVPRGRRGAVKPSEPDNREETEKEDLKRKAGTDDAPAYGVGRRGPSRRARPAPALEEQMSPILRGRNIKAKSTQPIKPNVGEEDEEEGGKPEEKADVPAPVGRRGASRCAQGAPAVAVPAGNAAAEEEPTAPIQGSHGVSVKSPEVIRLDDSEEDQKEDTKLEEKVEDLPAIGVGRRGTNRRAPAPAEAPATRRRAAASKHEAGDVAVEAVAIRSTRQRKPTMKAVAAAEEKAPRRAPRGGVVRKTIMPQEEQEEPLGVISDAEAVPAPVPDQEQEEPLGVISDAEAVPAPVPDQEQEEPLEAVPAPVPDQGCDGPGDLEVRSDPQNEEENEVVDAPKQEDEEISDVVIIEDEVLMEQTLQEQQVDDQKSPARMDNQEDSPILGLVSMAAEVDKVGNFQDTKCSTEEPLLEGIHDDGEEVEMVPSIQTIEDLVTLTAVESTKEVVTGDANRESEMRGSNELLHSREEISAVDTEDDASQEKENMDIDELQAELVNDAVLFDCSGNISMVDEEKANKVNTEDSLGCQKKGDVAVDTVLPDREEISEVDTEDDGASQVKENMYIDGLQAELVNDAVLFDCSGNISMVDEEIANEVNTEDSLGCLKKGDVAVDTVLPDREEISEVDTEDDLVNQKENKDTDELQTELAVETILFDCSGNNNNSLVYAEKTNEVSTKGGPGCQQKRDVAVDMALPYMAVAVENGDAVEENSAAITRGMPHSAAVVDEQDEETEIHPDERQRTMATEDEAIGDDHIGTDFDNGDKQIELVADDNLPEQTGANHKLTAQEMAVFCTEEMSQSTTTMDEDIEEDQFQAVSADQAVLISSKKVKMTDDEFDEETAPIIDEVQQSTVTLNEDVVDDQFEMGIVHDDEQEQVVITDEMTVGEIVEEDKAVVITEEVPQSKGTMDEYVEEDQLKIEVARADDNVIEMRQTEDDIVQKESAFTVDLVEDSSDHTTSALLENVTESLSKSIITLKPTESISEGISVCNNSSEKNNTAPPVAMQEEEGVKVAKKSLDLNKLSIRQLRTKIKEKLNAKKNKEAKRVALARVDENVCRSQPKGQQQNLNLQQH